MPTADAHVHLFEHGFAGVYGRLLYQEVAVYEQLMAQFGIRRALVVGYEGETPYIGNTDYVLSLARTRPWIAPVAYLPLTPPPTAERLRDLHARGAVGFALYLSDEIKAESVAAWPRPVLQALNDQHAIISLNATPAATALLGPFVDALGGCSFLFSHLGLPGRFQEAPSLEEARARLQPLLRLAERHNVAVKLSGLYAISTPPHDFPHPTARPILDTVLETYGTTRVCWGSDFAPALDFVSFGQVADDRLLNHLSATEAAGVMGENLRRLLPIPRAKE